MAWTENVMDTTISVVLTWDRHLLKNGEWTHMSYQPRWFHYMRYSSVENNGCELFCSICLPALKRFSWNCASPIGRLFREKYLSRSYSFNCIEILMRLWMHSLVWCLPGMSCKHKLIESQGSFFNYCLERELIVDVSVSTDEVNS